MNPSPNNKNFQSKFFHFFESVLLLPIQIIREVREIFSLLIETIDKTVRGIFGKASSIFWYCSYVFSTIMSILIFQLIVKNQIIYTLTAHKFDVYLALMISLPLFLLVIYANKKVFSRDAGKRWIGYLLVIFLWASYYAVAYFVHKNDLINPLTGQGVCITAENDRYKVVPCNWKSNNTNRNSVVEIPDQVLRAAEDPKGYIYPKKLPISSTLQFYSIDGVPLVYYHLDKEDILELSNLPIHHSRTNQLYKPITDKIIELIRVTENKLQEEDRQKENDKILQQKAETERNALAEQNRILQQQAQAADALRLKAEQERLRLEQQLREQTQLPPQVTPVSDKPNNLNDNYLTATCVSGLKPYFTEDIFKLSCCKAPSGELLNCVIPNLPNFCSRVLAAGTPALDLGENCCRNDEKQLCYSLFNGEAIFTEIPNAKLPKFCQTHLISYDLSQGYGRVRYSFGVPAPDLGENCCRSDFEEACFFKVPGKELGRRDPGQ